MIRFKEFSAVSESVKYHADNMIPLSENVFRMGSEKYFEVFKEARALYKEGKIEDTFSSMTKPMSKKLIKTIEDIL